MRKLKVMTAALFLLLSGCSGSGGQFSDMRNEVFEVTPITMTDTLTISIANPSKSSVQHLIAAGFDPKSNAAGHFRIESTKVGDQLVSGRDIAIPPGSTLNVKVAYAPINLETTLANYGGWITGVPEVWQPKPINDEEEEEEEPKAIHRSLIHFVYDKPREGVLYVQLIGEAVSGPNGEIAAGGLPGECTPGDGIACYSGGFAVDIPKLVPGGPQELIITGDVRLSIVDGTATLRMDDFPPALMILRSTEVAQLPAGVTATLVISGAPQVTAQGTFDGSRLELKGVAFRIRAVLGELDGEDVAGPISALVDFEIKDLTITTTEPFSNGEITLHLETTLSSAPTGNALFDDALKNARVIVIMRGNLEL